MKQTVKNTLPHIQKLIYEQYLNEKNKDSFASNGDWFPDRTKMTGNYYIGDVSYYKGYQIIMEIRMAFFEQEREDDYLGIDFSIEFDSINSEIGIDILGTESI